MSADARRVKDLFVAAVELADSQARQALLDRECDGDPHLRRRLEVLLQAHDHPEAVLERPLADAREPGAPAVAADAHLTVEHPAPSEARGTIVAGRYKLLECIGEGGMGTVWMAEQREPVKRLVAVKLIKPGMDSRAVLARFEAERQALALMDHPNIAKVLDGGTTAAGRPYFVMELVKGVPVTEYCDERHLTVRARLDLFVAICSAVQHAHQKGVIHRDLKPANLLVTEHDGQPVPKVIDFGLAKALHATSVLTEKTLHTSFGAVVGTTLYMAPEQVGINALDVDTRTDIYALGVVLYELLTGSTPLEKHRLKEAMWDEVRRLIREEEPPRPSARLSSSNALARIAAHRHVEPAKLSRLVRGELDWIVMKALEKDRSRRYETATGMARDIQRYLKDEPVEACPPSAAYRLRKFLQRHRGSVAVAVTVFLLGTAAGALSMSQAIRATRAEALALAERDAKEQARQAEADQRAAAVAQRERARKAEEQARQEAAVSRAVRDFLQADLLRQADTVAQAETLRLTGGAFQTQVNPTIRELLDRTAVGLAPDRIETRFPGQPRVQAEILDTVGRTYGGIGEGAAAVSHLTRAADLYRLALGPDDPTTLATLHALALAQCHVGNTADAMARLEKVRDARSARLGPDDPATLDTAAELGLVYTVSNKAADGVTLLEKVRDAAMRTVGPDAILTLKAQVYLANAYHFAGRARDALTLAEAVWNRGKKLLAPDHPYAVSGQFLLAELYREAGRTSDAIPLLRAVLDVRSAQYGLADPFTLQIVARLSAAYQDAGRPEEVLPLLRRAAEAARQRNGPTDPASLMAAEGLAVALANVGRYAEAEAVGRQRAAAVREKNGAASLAYAQALAFLGRVLMWQPGVPDGAEAVTREAVATYRTAGETASGDYAGALSNLGLLLLRQAKYADAEPVLRECLTIREKLAPGSWTRFNTTSQLGECLLGQGKYAESEPLLRAGYEGIKARETVVTAQDRARLAEAADRLARLCAATGRSDEAASWRAEQAKYAQEQVQTPKPPTEAR
jgi:serine/threonine protein kinase/tetratricopeptide (TPR) repeat protein